MIVSSSDKENPDGSFEKELLDIATPVRNTWTPSREPLKKLNSNSKGITSGAKRVLIKEKSVFGNTPSKQAVRITLNTPSSVVQPITPLKSYMQPTESYRYFHTNRYEFYDNVLFLY
jgi:hypothetical protein